MTGLRKGLRERKGLESAISHMESISSPPTENGPVRTTFREEDVLISKIDIDPHNSRTRYINQNAPLVNTLDKNHPHWEENQAVIDSIKALADHLKVSELQQSPGIYRNGNRYTTAFGNRRILACRVAFGDVYEIRVRVYDVKPAKIDLLRFAENSQREDLSLSSKVLDFIAANNYVKKSMPHIKIIEAANYLGISRNHYAKLNKIASSEPVLDAIKNGTVTQVSVATKLSKLDEEEQLNMAIDYIQEHGEMVWMGEKKAKAPAKEKGPLPSNPEDVSEKPVGKKKLNLKISGEFSPETMKSLVEGKIFELYDWSRVNWDNPKELMEHLNTCLADFQEPSEDNPILDGSLS